MENLPAASWTRCFVWYSLHEQNIKIHEDCGPGATALKSNAVDPRTAEPGIRKGSRWFNRAVLCNGRHHKRITWGESTPEQIRDPSRRHKKHHSNFENIVKSTKWSATPTCPLTSSDIQWHPLHLHLLITSPVSISIPPEAKASPKNAQAPRSRSSMFWQRFSWEILEKNREIMRSALWPRPETPKTWSSLISELEPNCPS